MTSTGCELVFDAEETLLLCAIRGVASMTKPMEAAQSKWLKGRANDVFERFFIMGTFVVLTTFMVTRLWAITDVHVEYQTLSRLQIMLGI